VAFYGDAGNYELIVEYKPEMRSINALSLSLGACEWLANSHGPGILHVFDNVCNLINAGREVLSIVTPKIGNGPFNLVVEDDVLFSTHLTAASPISIHANQLQLEDLTILITNAEIWSPRPNWEMLHARRNNIPDQLISLPLTTYELPTLELTAFLPLVHAPGSAGLSNSLIYSIANADIPSSRTASRKLAGLGSGLTPAGDDVIMGAVLAGWILHRPEVASVLAKEIADTAVPLTTSLSAAWLRSAGKGEAGILWHEFFGNLIATDVAQIQTSVNKILAVGESSGADALSGFIGTILWWAQVESSKLP
jgi:hypothetical protein